MSKYKFSHSEKLAVYSADSGLCFYCGTPLFYRDVQIDHVVPERLEDAPDELEELRQFYNLGPDWKLNSFENWATCHQGCNLRKLGDLLPRSPGTLVWLNVLMKRAPRLKEFRVAFEKRKRRETILATVEAAITGGEIEESDIRELLGDLPSIPTVTGTNANLHLTEHINLIVPGSPADQAALWGWTVHSVAGNVAYVSRKGGPGGYVPNVSNPDPTWQCSRCGLYGPWDGIICRNCGNREAPD